MTYSRRIRFGDGKSNLSRVEFARPFETRLRPSKAEPDATAATSAAEHVGRETEAAPAEQRPAGPPAPPL